MLASKNLLKPADGEPIISPSKDMVLGVYLPDHGAQPHAHKGDGRVFADMDEVELGLPAWARWTSTARIKVRVTTWYDDKGDRLPEAGNTHH